MKKLFFVSCLFLALASVCQADTFSDINGIKLIDGVTYPLTGAGLQQAINDQIAAGGGQVWLTKPVTITSTLTIGRNSPSQAPVHLVLIPPGQININITNFTDAIMLSEASFLDCRGYGAEGGPPSHFPINLAGTAKVRDVVRALIQDATQETMFIDGCSVNANGSGGAFVSRYVYDYSELFVPSFLRNVTAFDHSAQSGTAYAIGIETCGGPMSNCGVSGLVRDGSSGVTFDNVWSDSSSAAGACVNIDGTANKDVSIAWDTFHNLYCESGVPQILVRITAADNTPGQIKDVWFNNSEFGILGNPTNTNIIVLDGCNSCGFTDDSFSAYTNSNTNNAILLENIPNKPNFGNSFVHVHPNTGGFMNTVADNRTQVFTGNVVVNYVEDQGAAAPNIENYWKAFALYSMPAGTIGGMQNAVVCGNINNVLKCSVNNGPFQTVVLQ